MQATESGAAIKRLHELADGPPGLNSAALSEAKTIFLRLGGEGATGYLLEKLTAAQGSFETWFSVSEWQKHGSDPQQSRANLLLDIEKLRKALARGASGQD